MNITGHIGRLTAAPELKQLQSTTVCNFQIAFKTGKNKSAFVLCRAFGGTGEAIHKYFKKGQLIGVKGHLDQDRWEKDGYKQERTYIVVEEFTFCEKKSNTEVNGNVEDEDGMPF